MDQEYAEYAGHLDRLLEAADLLESAEAVDRTAIIASAVDQGLRGTEAQRARKAIVLAAVAIDRLSRKEPPA
jgi:hypothetical protein